MSAMALQANDLARLFGGGAAKRVILLINVLLVIWIAAQLAALTWALLPQPEHESRPVVARTAAIAPGNPYAGLISSLPGWHLMGVAASKTTPVENNTPLNAPETRLRLTLSGVLASDDKQHARAIIADQGGKEEQYAIGDTLPGNAELGEVYPDRVILKRGGRYETLRLPTEGTTGGNITAFARTHTPATPAERLREVRANISKSPRSMYDLVSATQQFDDSGNIIGYSVAPGRKPELFEEVGLQPGDVVTEVNGLALSEPANGGKALKSLQSGKAVTVKLLRGGQEHILTLDTQQ